MKMLTHIAVPLFLFYQFTISISTGSDSFVHDTQASQSSERNGEIETFSDQSEAVAHQKQRRSYIPQFIGKRKALQDDSDALDMKDILQNISDEEEEDFNNRMSIFDILQKYQQQPANALNSALDETNIHLITAGATPFHGDEDSESIDEFDDVETVDKRGYRPMFVGKRAFAPPFIGRRAYVPLFLGRRAYAPYFVGKKASPMFSEKEKYRVMFVGKREDEETQEEEKEEEEEEEEEEKRASLMFVGKKYIPNFIGKRYIPRFVGKRHYIPRFIGKRPIPSFVGKRYIPRFIGKRSVPSFVDERPVPNFAGKRYIPSFVGRRMVPSFVGKRYIPSFVGKRKIPMFVGKRKFPVFVGNRRLSPFDEKQDSPLVIGEKSDDISAVKNIDTKGKISTEVKSRRRRSVLDDDPIFKEDKKAWGRYFPWDTKSKISPDTIYYVSKRYAKQFANRNDIYDLSDILKALKALDYARGGSVMAAKRINPPLFVGKRTNNLEPSPIYETNRRFLYSPSSQEIDFLTLSNL
ncbi:hypothetical protein CHS0354_031749 [Potamilus streckersoni]|uniref:Uncharacterized protein n=1 Tax=Potamilus streckersoni TaxID=2493646 RepID=A0AAE0T5X6_9BIVA|nr:hypothetical protein CHS0354_031749 [Potamilus streckersoni]